MTERLTCPCKQPIHDNATLCHDCTARLRGDLHWLARHGWPELQRAITRQDALPAGSGHSDARLAYNIAASAAADVVQNTLTTWARVLVDDLHLPLEKPRPAGPACARCEHPTCTVMRLADRLTLTVHQQPAIVAALHLARHVDRIRLQDFGPDLADEIGHTRTRVAEAAVDRPPDLTYLGRCDICTTDLYARPHKPTTTCRQCEAVYDVPERKGAVLLRVEDELGTAVEIARALTSLGDPVTPERIRQWGHRGRLVEKGKDRRGHRMYRVGDARALLVEDETRRAEKAS